MGQLHFKYLWEETRLKLKTNVGSNEKNQAQIALKKIKGKFGKFGPQKKNKNMAKVQCYGCQ